MENKVKYFEKILRNLSKYHLFFTTLAGHGFVYWHSKFDPKASIPPSHWILWGTLTSLRTAAIDNDLFAAVLRFRSSDLLGQ